MMKHNASTFSPIDNNLLADVLGGCGCKKRRCCNQQVNITNNNCPPARAPASASVEVGYAQPW